MPSFPHAQPLEGLIGGLLIGLAAAAMLIGNGRVAGVGGLFARATGIEDSGPTRSLAILFIVGLVVGALLYALAFGPVVARFPPSTPTLAAAGMIVGYRTKLGGGCTSGHGVCGMSRLMRCRGSTGTACSRAANGWPDPAT